MSSPTVDRRDHQAVRLAVGFLGLAVIWGVAFNASDLPFFPLVTAGGAVTGLVGVWVRRAPQADRPGFAVTPRTAALAVGAALVHFAVGHGLFAVAAEILPSLAATAGEVYEASGAIPLWGQVVLGAIFTGGMEEVFWRGAFTPIVADRVTGRMPEGLSPVRQGIVLVIVSTIGYTLFHVVTLKLALVAAAALGGLVWGTLLLVTRSVGVVMIAHVLWTGLMILFPPALS